MELFSFFFFCKLGFKSTNCWTLAFILFHTYAKKKYLQIKQSKKKKVDILRMWSLELEMAQQLRALVNLPEGPGSVTYTHMMFQPFLTHRRPDTPFWPPWYQSFTWYLYTQAKYSYTWNKNWFLKPTCLDLNNMW